MNDEKELKDQRIPIMMTPSEVEAIDDWMFSNRIRSRGEAIRRLCRLGLNTDAIFSDLTGNLGVLHRLINTYDLEERSEFSESLARTLWDVMQPYVKLRSAVIAMRNKQPIDVSFAEIEEALKSIDERSPDYFDSVRKTILGYAEIKNDK